MNIKQIMKDLKNRAQEEISIHKELFEEATDDVKDLVRKHLCQTMAAHKAFWRKIMKKTMKKK